MPGMFPATFLGGVPASNAIPNAYEPISPQQYCTFYSSGCVTITQAQMNSLLSEFACVFDKAGWNYQPGEHCNLWGALVSAFGGGSGGNAGVTGVIKVNGQTGPIVSLEVADIPGAAPLNSPNLVGNPTAPTQAPGDSTKRLANTQFVQGAIAAALNNLNQIATTTTLGMVMLASPADVVAGTAGKVIDAAQLKGVLSVDLQNTFGAPIGSVALP